MDGRVARAAPGVRLAHAQPSHPADAATDESTRVDFVHGLNQD